MLASSPPIQQLLRACRWLLVGLVASAWLSACFSSTPHTLSTHTTSNSADCRAVEHRLGTTRVCGQPQRIAVLSPHILDVMLALGAQPAAYAESVALDFERFDHPTQQIPYLGDRIVTQPVNLGDRKSPSIERLTMLQPDLILGEDWLAGDSYSLLSHIAPTLLFSDDLNGIQHWRNTITPVAKALGREASIRQVNAQVIHKLEDTRLRLAPVVGAFPRVLILSANNSLTDVAIAADSTVGSLLEDIGFELVFPQPTIDGEPRWQTISTEILPSLEADIAIVIGWDASDFYSQAAKLKSTWNNSPLLTHLPVAKANRIFFVDYQLWGSITRGPITDELILSRLVDILSPLLSQ